MPRVLHRCANISFYQVDINLADRQEILSTFNPGEAPPPKIWESVSTIWVEQPPTDRIHILVRLPASGGQMLLLLFDKFLQDLF